MFNRRRYNSLIDNFTFWGETPMIADYDSLHAGMPVTSGEKWIAIVWVREKKFQ